MMIRYPHTTIENKLPSLSPPNTTTRFLIMDRYQSIAGNFLPLRIIQEQFSGLDAKQGAVFLFLVDVVEQNLKAEPSNTSSLLVFCRIQQSASCSLTITLILRHPPMSIPRKYWDGRHHSGMFQPNLTWRWLHFPSSRGRMPWVLRTRVRRELSRDCLFSVIQYFLGLCWRSFQLLEEFPVFPILIRTYDSLPNQRTEYYAYRASWEPRQ